jgi:hypothetical protein
VLWFYMCSLFYHFANVFDIHVCNVFDIHVCNVFDIHVCNVFDIHVCNVFVYVYITIWMSIKTFIVYCLLFIVYCFVYPTIKYKFSCLYFVFVHWQYVTTIKSKVKLRQVQT